MTRRSTTDRVTKIRIVLQNKTSKQFIFLVVTSRRLNILSDSLSLSPTLFDTLPTVPPFTCQWYKNSCLQRTCSLQTFVLCFYCAIFSLHAIYDYSSKTRLVFKSIQSYQLYFSRRKIKTTRMVGNASSGCLQNADILSSCQHNMYVWEHSLKTQSKVSACTGRIRRLIRHHARV